MKRGVIMKERTMNKIKKEKFSEKNTRGPNMLLNFKVKNFLSYKGLTKLSMVAGNTKLKSERLQKEKDYSILKFSAIFGANASGKSNFINAVELMKNFVLGSTFEYQQDLYYKLDESCKHENSYFEVELVLDGKVYAFGFEFSFFKNKFTSEWLFELSKEETLIYERDIVNGNYNYNLPLSDGLNERFKVYFEDLKNNDDMLFLTSISKNKFLSQEAEVKTLFDVLSWFRSSLQITEPSSVLTSGEYILVEDKLKELSELLSKFDTGISEMTTVKVLESEIRENLPTKFLDRIQSDLINDKGSSASLLRVGNSFWIIKCENKDKEKKFSYEKVCFYHSQNKEVMFGMKEESEGTIRLLDLAEILLTDEQNKVFFIDELDRCLHPQMSCQFVREFLKNAKKSNNQLIVTTHESRLLDFNILRRDEIWFADKKDGETSLYSLEEFNERFDRRIDKAYLDGRYGGVPIFNAVFPVDCNENF